MVRARTSKLLKRSAMLLIIFCLLAPVLCVNTAAALPGSGTQEDPWRIESLADFDEFAADPNYWSGFTRLETDVNLAGRTYSTAIIAPDTDNSKDYFQGTAFTGVFDGNGHKIINLTIDDGGAGNDFLGLFGYIGEYAGEVRNLGIEGGSISGNVYVGGLAGRNNDGVITKCYSTGDVRGTGRFVGGLVGDNSGSVSSCYSAGDVSGGSWDAGGLMGRNWGIVWNCYSTGDVNGRDVVAALVGYNDGSISNCYSTSSVNGGEYVGGLVGINWGIVSNSHSTGSVSGNGYYVGDLVGGNYGSASNCYSTGDVNGRDVVGGLVGYNDESISNCYSTSSVSGGDYVGGLVAINSGSVSNCYSTGSVSGDDYVGGLVGTNWDIVSNSFWDTDTQTHGVTESIGEDYGTVTNVAGLLTTQMQTHSTFTEAGWDFVEIWLINEGATYPVLRQEIRSDLNGDGGVDMLDFAIFADHWLEGTGD